jgi:hypothetical protein
VGASEADEGTMLKEEGATTMKQSFISWLVNTAMSK